MVKGREGKSGERRGSKEKIRERKETNTTKRGAKDSKGESKERKKKHCRQQ